MSSLSNIKETLRRNGAVCILPTETVYGLAGRATNTSAIARIYDIKGREFSKSLAVCVEDVKQAMRFGEFSQPAYELAWAFWPGPLTLVVPASNFSLDKRCYFEDTIAFRCPDVDWREHLLETPLALTSANLSGKPDATTADTEINAHVDAVLDYGEASAGEPSTIISVTQQGFKCLREGALKADALAAYDIEWPND